ncbi:hypothetical protein Tco_1148634 [Tanacetum coccineum]
MKTLLCCSSLKNSKKFVFGPFTPATAHRAGTLGNKRLTHAQDGENLADSYRPQYRNKEKKTGAQATAGGQSTIWVLQTPLMEMEMVRGSSVGQVVTSQLIFRALPTTSL